MKKVETGAHFTSCGRLVRILSLRGLAITAKIAGSRAATMIICGTIRFVMIAGFLITMALIAQIMIPWGITLILKNHAPSEEFKEVARAVITLSYMMIFGFMFLFLHTTRLFLSIRIKVPRTMKKAVARFEDAEWQEYAAAEARLLEDDVPLVKGSPSKNARRL